MNAFRRNSNKAAKPNKAFYKRWPFWKKTTVILSSHAFIAALLVFSLTPPVVNTVNDYRAAVAAQEELAAALAVKVANERLSIQEKALMVQFKCLQKTVAMETQRYNRDDMRGILRNILWRVKAPGYPKTPCGVTNQFTENADGTKTFQYSSQDGTRPNPKPWDINYKMAGLVVNELYVMQFLDGIAVEGTSNFVAPYVLKTTWWVKKGLRDCSMEIVGTVGYHVHLNQLDYAERQECRDERKKAAEAIKAVTNETLPSNIPVPRPRPTI